MSISKYRFKSKFPRCSVTPCIPDQNLRGIKATGVRTSCITSSGVSLCIVPMCPRFQLSSDSRMEDHLVSVMRLGLVVH